MDFGLQIVGALLPTHVTVHAKTGKRYALGFGALDISDVKFVFPDELVGVRGFQDDIVMVFIAELLLADVAQVRLFYWKI